MLSSINNIPQNSNNVKSDISSTKYSMQESTNNTQELIKKGYNINDDSLIFSDHKTNKPISDTKLRKNFYKYSELAGVNIIRLYDLRHTYVATMMEEEKEYI